jgi:hypothetical protein
MVVVMVVVVGGDGGDGGGDGGRWWLLLLLVMVVMVVVVVVMVVVSAAGAKSMLGFGDYVRPTHDGGAGECSITGCSRRRLGRPLPNAARLPHSALQPPEVTSMRGE